MAGYVEGVGFFNSGEVVEYLDVQNIAKQTMEYVKLIICQE